MLNVNASLINNLKFVTIIPEQKMLRLWDMYHFYTAEIRHIRAVRKWKGANANYRATEVNQTYLPWLFSCSIIETTCTLGWNLDNKITILDNKQFVEDVYMVNICLTKLVTNLSSILEPVLIDA